MRLLLTVLLATSGYFLLGQPADTIFADPLPELNEQRLEDLLQDNEEDGDFDLNTAFEDLQIYLDHPLNLNEASIEDLRELRLLSDVQISNLLSYREQLGGLISIYELQAIPGFDLTTIKRVIPFVGLKSDVDDFQAGFQEMFTKGSNELYLRWNRVLERQRGFQPLAEHPDSSAYLGDPNQLYLRYRHTYSNRLSYGFTAEKDRGEEFFTGSNRKGFDFYSAHLFLKDYNQRIKAVALGDYNANFGQGLVLFTGFGYGKSSLVTSVQRGGRHLRQYTSVNEANFLRGAATTIALNDNLELTALASYRQRDGNLVFLSDTLTLELDGSFARFSSLNLSGLHRTAAEIADQNAVGHFIGGGSLKWTAKKGHIAINTLYHQLDKPLRLTPRVYNQFFFQGDQLFNGSIDYSWRIRNFTLFGETAISDNGAVATLNGLLGTLHRNLNLAIVHRHFPRNYQALLADPFAETSGGRNESGLYIGIELFPAKHWILSGYFDAWRHPWLLSYANLPSRGHEYRLRLTYFQKRKLEAYLEVRDESKQINVSDVSENLRFVPTRRRIQARLHFSYKVSRALEWRSRLDWGETVFDGFKPDHGFAIYQDLLFYPIDKPWIFTTRLALFDTDGYNVRFYNYENGLLYNFRIPAYYNQGSRFYINARYKGIRNVTLEARYARLFWANQDSIGSSWENTGQPTRTEIGVQIKIKF